MDLDKIKKLFLGCREDQRIAFELLKGDDKILHNLELLEILYCTVPTPLVEEYLEIKHEGEPWICKTSWDPIKPKPWRPVSWK